MGRVYQQIRIVGSRATVDVKALVDTGYNNFLAVPKDVGDMIGVENVRPGTADTADVDERPALIGTVREVQMGERSTFRRLSVVPVTIFGYQVLLGALALELMNVVVDPGGRILQDGEDHEPLPYSPGPR